MKRVVVGLSGGVDSSVAAYLLKEQGYEVIGLFMKNWHDDSVTISNECPWLEDSNDALLVAEKLGIPFQTVDLSEQYKEKIVDYMFNEYEKGRTPNPDVLCNREIKFDVFLKAAMELGADYVATGHYCRKIEHEDGTFGLLAGKDPNKDQSYFLCQLSQEQLAKALFPIGELLKSEVRQIASEIGLVTADKKDSQGLCFVGKISLPVFLQQQLAQKKGNIVEIPDTLPQFSEYHSLAATEAHLEQLVQPFTFHESDGIKVHEHIGAHYYTIGQRKGLHIGGRPNPSFVIGIDTATNTVYTGQEETHPGLNRIALFISNDEINYINSKYILNTGDSLVCTARIRYRQPLQKATLHQFKDGMYVVFENPQSAITEGQFVAWHLNDEVLGSGVIA